MTPIVERLYKLLPLTRDYVLTRGALDSDTRNRIGANLLALVQSESDNVDWPSIRTIDLVEQHRDLLSWAVEDAFNREQHILVLKMVRAIGHALGIRGYNSLRLRLGKLEAYSARAISNQQELARVLITNTAWVHFGIYQLSPTIYLL